MFASDCRRLAREALRKKWLRTTLILLLATLLGASAGVTAVNMGSGGVQYEMSYMEQGITLETFRDIVRISAGIIIALNLISVFIGSLVRVGMFRLGDKLLDGEKPRVSMLFPRGIYWKAVGVKLLTMLFVTLWSFLFVIPGIIASYKYAMAEYLIYKYPQLTPMQAIAMSKQRMNGHKLDLFVLQEISFIGWALLCSLPTVITTSVAAVITRGQPVPDSLMLLFAAGLLVSAVCALFLNTYIHVSVCAFFRHLDHPWHAHQAETRYGWDAGTVETEAQDSEEQQQPNATQRPVDTESLAKELFHRYGCSRQRMTEAGEMETYASYRVDSSVESRWLRERGQALMLRFSHDPEALDELLPLVGEYGMDELLDRAIERIERHIRQNTLPGEELMHMAGRCLAAACSGAFADRASYVQRKRAQVFDIAQRLAAQLEENEPEGGWRSAYAMICRLSETE